MATTAEFVVSDLDSSRGIIKLITVKGEVNIGKTGVDRMHQILSDLVDQDIKLIVIDLHDCAYMVSRGFGQCLIALARIRTRRGDICAIRARGAVWAAASTVGLDNIISFYADVEQALEHLNESGFARPRPDQDG